jgi:hypothetical protein
MGLVYFSSSFRSSMSFSSTDLSVIVVEKLLPFSIRFEDCPEFDNPPRSRDNRQASSIHFLTYNALI